MNVPLALFVFSLLAMSLGIHLKSRELTGKGTVLGDVRARTDAFLHGVVAQFRAALARVNPHEAKRFFVLLQGGMMKVFHFASAALKDASHRISEALKRKRVLDQRGTASFFMKNISPSAKDSSRPELL